CGGKLGRRGLREEEEAADRSCNEQCYGGENIHDDSVVNKDSWWCLGSARGQVLASLVANIFEGDGIHRHVADVDGLELHARGNEAVAVEGEVDLVGVRGRAATTTDHFRTDRGAADVGVDAGIH